MHCPAVHCRGHALYRCDRDRLPGACFRRAGFVQLDRRCDSATHARNALLAGDDQPGLGNCRRVRLSEPSSPVCHASSLTHLFLFLSPSLALLSIPSTFSLVSYLSLSLSLSSYPELALTFGRMARSRSRSCSGEAFSALCTFCWSLHDAAPPNCSDTPSPTLVVPLTADGTVVITVTAVDAAGNTGNPVHVTVIRDTVPPVTTSAVLKDHNVFVPALQAYAIALLGPTLIVTGDKPLAHIHCDIGNGQFGSSTIWTQSGEVPVDLSGVLRGGAGFVNVTVRVEDLAGNVDRAGVFLPLVVIGGEH